MSGRLATWLHTQLLPRPARPAAPLSAGLRSFERELDGRRCRLHLRIDADGGGLLVCNASAGLRLQPTGVRMAVGLLEGRGAEEVTDDVLAAFAGAGRARVRQDVAQVDQALQALALGRDGRFPLRDLAGGAAGDPLQVALDSAAPETLRPALEGLWARGVPFVTLLDRADAEPDWLVAAVERAEDLGMIAGLRATGSRLAAEGRIGRLLEAGVDAVTVPWTGPTAEVHDRWHGTGDRAAARQVLDQVQAAECCAIAELALVGETVDALDQTVASVTALGLRTLSIFAVTDTAGGLSPEAVQAAATRVEALGSHMNAVLIWNPPVAAAGRPLQAVLRAGPLSAGSAS